MPRHVQLLIIDPQNDFCDPVHGALAVKGAADDMLRLAGLIRRIGPQIDRIHVTLDTHQLVHVAHPIYWQDEKGQNPQPFTIITAADVRTGRWLPARPDWLRQTRPDFGALDYVEALAAKSKAPLCIWPPHCLLGSWGHNVFPPLLAALQEWEAPTFSAVEFITKGAQHHTEHYSAICAEVPDPQEPGTQLNTELLEALHSADEILLAGEAASHCVANTALDADEFFSDGSFTRKLTLLTDTTSSIAGYEAEYEAFVGKLSARGMRLATTAEFGFSEA